MNDACVIYIGISTPNEWGGIYLRNSSNLEFRTEHLNLKVSMYSVKFIHNTLEQPPFKSQRRI